MSAQQVETQVNQDNSSNTSSVQALLASLVDMAGSQAQATREMHRNLKRLVTEVERETKRMQKTSRPRRTVTQKPVNVTAAMSKWLSAQSVDAQDGGYTRQAMMRAVSAYIKKAELQVAENRKSWKPDATLVKLFNLDKKQTYTFMNINGLLSRVVQSS